MQALALINYGHFTSFRVDDGKVRGLRLHLRRLVRDCRKVFDVALDPDRVRELIKHALADAPRSVGVRVTVFDPDLELGHPGADAHPQILVTTRPAPASSLPPLRVCTMPYVREMPDVKHVGLFGALRLRRDAQRKGFDDVLFTDHDGNVSEGATWNIGFVINDRVAWPKADVLPGVTMALLNQAMDTPPREGTVNVADLTKAQDVFATNASVGVRSVAAIDGHEWPEEHPLVRRLRQLYTDVSPEPL